MYRLCSGTRTRKTRKWADETFKLYGIEYSSKCTSNTPVQGVKYGHNGLVQRKESSSRFIDDRNKNIKKQKNIKQII